MNKKIIYIISILIIVIFYIFFSLNHVITEYFWYKSVNAETIYWKIFNTKIAISTVVFLLFFTVIYLNLKISLSATKNTAFNIRFNQRTSIDINFYINKLVNSGVLVISFFFAFITLKPSAEMWDELLQFQNATVFNIDDPIFHNDLGFYFFKMPLIAYTKNILISLALLSLITSGVIYFFKGAIQLVSGWYNKFARNVKIHMGMLIVIILLLFGFHFWLLRFDLLYSTTGVSTGAGYTDTHSRLFAYNVIAAIFLLSVPVVIYSMFSNKVKPLFFGALTLIASVIIFLILAPVLQQKFVVEPNELEKERPYIINSIEFTRKAYGLDHVGRIDYPVDNTLTEKDLANYRSTFENIRLWDWRPLLSTYRQIQELRLYYTFEDVDVDRYLINGSYKQFMLSVRELNYEQMPEQGKTWVNQRLRYTHGYGLVASPVDRVTKEGLPDLVVQDIPPTASVPILEINRPGIYYGEKVDDYIFTGTGMDEFDYPLGDDNKLTRYSGQGGVPMGSFWKRLLYAIDNNSIKILISRYFTKETKILYNRKILTIVNKIAPFLKYDNDPYIVIVNGQLKWILDAYTVSDQYPYSQAVTHRINYIRNSVKVVVDAYDGNADFYITDNEDPLVKTYAKIFPELFKNSSEVPDEIRKHFRYPLDLFKLQSSIFLSYHMTQPEVFYNQEDLWKFPREIYENHEDVMDPYYIIMQLNGLPLNGNREESLLILPFTPSNKNNMIAWLAAGSDTQNYGKLMLYEFPKQELVYGPMQIEARINQTPEISEALTLWNQQGSSVIRGNLLVIPINHTLLYVEPLYLQAEKSKMPELKRVIVSYMNQVVMRETLEECLRAVFSMANMNKEIAETSEKDFSRLASQAFEEFQMGEKALKMGDWAEYGRRQKSLSSLLQQMQKRTQK